MAGAAGIFQMDRRLPMDSTVGEEFLFLKLSRSACSPHSQSDRNPPLLLFPATIPHLDGGIRSSAWELDEQRDHGDKTAGGAGARIEGSWWRRPTRAVVHEWLIDAVPSDDDHMGDEGWPLF